MQPYHYGCQISCIVYLLSKLGLQSMTRKYTYELLSGIQRSFISHFTRECCNKLISNVPRSMCVHNHAFFKRIR